MQNKESLDNNRKDQYLAIPIFLYLVLTVICVFGRNMLFMLPIPHDVYTAIRYGLTGVAVIRAVLVLNRTERVGLLFLELFFGISYLVCISNNLFLRENYQLYLISTLLVCVPLCVFCASFNDISNLYGILLKASIINAVILILYMITYDLHETSIYDMSGAYQLLFCFSIQLNEVISHKPKKRFLYYILIALELYYIFVRGSRGPLFCVVIFVCLLIFTQFRHNRRAVLLSLCGIALFIAVYVNYYQVLSLMSTFFQNSGTTSRTFQAILNRTLLNDSGRSELLRIARQCIKDNPILGYGASADCKLLGGAYVHNLPYELAIDFGIPLGGLLFLAVSIGILISVFKENGIKTEIIIILVVSGYVMLFMSGTYLQNVYFFMLVGTMICQNHWIRIRIK